MLWFWFELSTSAPTGPTGTSPADTGEAVWRFSSADGETQPSVGYFENVLSLLMCFLIVPHKHVQQAVKRVQKHLREHLTLS